MKKNSAGFTLIELLVVIAIIGILSSIVLSSLNNSRVRANDSKVKTQLTQLRSAAELYYNSTGNSTYGGVVNGSQATTTPNFGNGCSNDMFTDPILDPYTASAAYPNGTMMKCTSTGTDYQVTASLSQNTGGANPDFWCVNSKGVSKLIEGATHLAAHPNGDVDCTP